MKSLITIRATLEKTVLIQAEPYVYPIQVVNNLLVDGTLKLTVEDDLVKDETFIEIETKKDTVYTEEYDVTSTINRKK